MSCLNRFFILMLILFISFPMVLGFSGISPAKVTVNFEPNLVKDVEFNIYGYDEPEVKVGCPYISIEDVSRIDDHHQIRLQLQLPAEMEVPGKNICDVNVDEKKEKEDIIGIGTKTSVGGKIIINVPYPGLYARLDMTASNVNKDEPAIFHIAVRNLGEQELKDIKVNVKIYDIDGKLVDMISTDRVSIEKYSFRDTDLAWPTKDVESGRYKAVASLEYEGDRKVETKADFIVGRIFVEFKEASLRGQPFQINPFDITVESWWGNVIRNVYADVSMKNGSGVDAGKFRTVSVDLKPWQTTTISGHWEALQWGPGNYSADIIIHYEDETSTGEWTYELENLPEEEGSLFLDKMQDFILNPIFLIAVILIIVIIDFSWILIKKRRKKNGKK